MKSLGLLHNVDELGRQLYIIEGKVVPSYLSTEICTEQDWSLEVYLPRWQLAFLRFFCSERMSVEKMGLCEKLRVFPPVVPY